MISNSLLQNQIVSCIISDSNYNTNGVVQDINNQELILRINGVFKTYPMNEINCIMLDKKIVYANSCFIDSLYSQESDSITNDEKRILDIFFQIVEGYPVNYGFKNNNLCIKKIDYNWYLFNVIDNEIISVDKYNDLMSTIMLLFDSLSNNNDCEIVWLKEFSRLVHREYQYSDGKKLGQYQKCNN